VLPRSVSQQDLCGYEEGWLTQASDQTNATEPIHEEHTLHLGMMRDLLKHGDWMALIDLNDAYLLVAVWEDHPPLYVAGHHIRIPVSSLRVVSAPRVFTKLLKPVLAQLRQQGACVIMYLDDMLLMEDNWSKLHCYWKAWASWSTERNLTCTQPSHYNF